MTLNCGYCRDCKWWDTKYTKGTRFDGWGYCNMAEGKGYWPAVEQSLAFAPEADIDDWRPGGELLTCPNFGCIQFQARLAEEVE